MGLYGANNDMGGIGKTIKSVLHDFPGVGIAKAKIIVQSTKEECTVQFNPQTLTFSGAVTQKDVPTVGSEKTDAVNIYAKPTITLSVELLFDAFNDDGLMDHIKGGNFLKNVAAQGAKKTASKIGNGSKIFPIPYGDVSKQIDFFYDIMTIYCKRRVEFAWNKLSFIGDIDSVSVNILLFDASGNPTRAKINISIKQSREEHGMGEIGKKSLTGAMNMLTRKG